MITVGSSKFDHSRVRIFLGPFSMRAAKDFRNTAFRLEAARRSGNGDGTICSLLSNISSRATIVSAPQSRIERDKKRMLQYADKSQSNAQPGVVADLSRLQLAYSVRITAAALQAKAAASAPGS
jgi:hypothetical protein